MTTMINLYEFSKESKAVTNTEVRVNIMVLVHLRNYKNTCYLCVYSVLMIQELPSFCYHEYTWAATINRKRVRDRWMIRGGLKSA